MKEVSLFLADCRGMVSHNKLGLYLVQRYRALFGTEPPNAMLCLIQAKICYRLQYVYNKSAGIKMSPAFLKNYEASQKLNIEAFDDSMKQHVLSSIKQEQKQGDQNVIEKAKKKLTLKNVGKKIAEIVVSHNKTKSERPGAVFVHLFATNATAKLTDEQIAKEVVKRCPGAKKYTAADVKGYRGGYNRGVLSGQAEKPSNVSVSYDKK